MRPTLVIALALLAAPVPALAQSAGDSSANGAALGSFFNGDYLIVGIGGAVMPSYEGSNNYIVTGAPVVRGSYHGFDFESRGTALAVDILPNPNKSSINLLLGPELRLNLDRSSRINDAAVAALNNRNVAIEGGGFIGVGVSGVLNPYDTVTARVDAVADLGNVHDGYLITPSIGYSTPFSKAVFAFLTVEGTWASDNYNDTYFSFTPTAASGGLAGPRAFAANGGWKDVKVTIGATYDLSGDLTDGGFGIFAGGSYERLLGDAAASPIVSVFGSPNQWLGAIGITYGF